MANSRLCSIPGCGNPHSARGWCATHVRRFYRYGDPLLGEPTRTPPGAPRRYYETVVLPYEGDDCLIWPFNRVGRGYAEFSRDGKKAYVHREVCEYVHGPAPTPSHQAAHSCGNGDTGCVTKRHLRWATPKENNNERKAHGTVPFGENHPSAKLSLEQVLEIKSLLGSMSQSAIGASFGVSQKAISFIARGINWASVT